jgi:carboxyl-terminal processing protease
MKKFYLSILLLAVAASSVLAQSQKITPERKLRLAEAIIENYYVEDVDENKLVEEGIIAMLKTLDPHSAYSDAKETQDLNQPLQGKFSGIGIQFTMNNDSLYVIQTTSGGPSEKVGILPGDRIISANDTVISGVKKTNSDIISILRGPKGSKVNLKVKRGNEIINFKVTRDDIPIYSVDAAYMADATTGYIRVSRFAEDTGKEVKEAMKKLKAKGMVNLIIDLEDNGGGYLGSAFDLASMFLRNRDLVVYTQGRKAEPSYFRADGDGEFLNGKLVIMVNQYSASASEILSGAIQDNDRGLIVGRRTFGKGLVQRPFPFPDGSMIRLTTAHYYTPSGRSIQKPYTKGDQESYEEDLINRYKSGELVSKDSIHFADSLQYKTLKNERIVYGGGGIMPDRFVPIDTSYYSTYYRDLVAKGVLNQYVITYIDKNRKQLKKEYSTEDKFFNEFNVSDKMIEGIVEIGEKEGVKLNQESLNTSRPLIATVVKGMMFKDLFEDASYYRVSNTINPIYKQALELINDDATYNSLLSGK